MTPIRTALLATFISLVISLNGQTQHSPDFTCGFDQLRTPAQEQAMQWMDAQLRAFMLKKAMNGSPDGISGLPYTVPVVVHIIHNSGAENIPDAQILAAIDNLNTGFAAQGYFAQLGAMVNTQIQFCLAKRDPDGNATTGITRTQSPLTNMVMETDDIAAKDLNRWNPKDYVNIWVVKEITSLSQGPGVAGYAYFPSAHGLPQDGMICEARFFGKSPADDAVLIHEMGHYFGLYHTFEGGCKNDDCTADGDHVCDTPPDNATHTVCTFNSCNTDVAPGSPFNTDVNDFTGDFMDYSPLTCYNFFTPGQALRMQGSVEVVRKSLLVSKGCVDPCTQPIVADFSAAPNPALVGQVVTLTNNSTGASSFSWQENGVPFSQNQNTTRVFNAVGNFVITLEVSNADPNCSDKAQAVVQVQCPIEANFSVPIYEIAPGETLDFTNTSAGGAADFEWSVNGFALATTTNFSYQFLNPGYYTVKLQVSGAACSREKTVQIHVKSHCGDPFFATTEYSINPSAILAEDMIGLPDGSLILCGRHAQQPMMTRLDAVGNVVWNKLLDINGLFNDIEALPDGNFVLRGQANGRLLLAKVDPDGNILWFQTLQNPDGFYNTEYGVNSVAANPDGSFAFFFRGNNNSGAVGKILANGTVEWIRYFQVLQTIGGLRRATDGSEDYLISTTTAVFGSLEQLVLRVSQAGDLVTIYRYSLPQLNMEIASIPFLGVHPDGDFSLVFVAGVASPAILEDKFLIRCQPDGQPRWAKKIAATGLSSANLRAQYFAGEGWLLTDYKNNSDNYLLRINEQNELIWHRKVGSGGIFGDAALAAVKQNGQIRASKWISVSKRFQLLQLPDVYTPISCLPDTPTEEIVSEVPVLKVAGSTSTTSLSLSFFPEPYTVVNTPLNRSPACSIMSPCPEICDNELDDDDDGFVDCFDSDCPCFDSDTACMINLPISTISAKLAWESNEDVIHWAGVPIVANLNPQQDSIPEILVISGEGISFTSHKLLIFKGDGSNASNPDSLFFPEGIYTFSPAHPMVADLDRNGIPELVVVTSDSRIRVFTDFNPNANPCMKAWALSPQLTASKNSRVYAADFNGDGIGEILCGNDVFKLNMSNPAVLVLEKVLDGIGAFGRYAGLTLTAEQSSTAADLLTPADCNGDPDCNGLEIAAGYHIYSVDLDTGDGDGLQIKIQRNLDLLDSIGSPHKDGYTSVADIDLDGVPDIIVSAPYKSNGGGIYVWNKNGLVHNFYHTSLTKMYGMVCVANVFDDRTEGFAQDYPELIVTQENELVCLNLQKAQATPAQPYWWRIKITDKYSYPGATVFDFNGDGISEIVYRDEDDLRILYGGPTPFPVGVDVDRNWFKTISGSGTLDEYPVIADLDNDGQAEIAVTSFNVRYQDSPNNGFGGRLRVFESAGLPWMPARPIWNQFNYFGVNINDDLTVPKTQQKHWLETGGIGSGKRPLNTHLAQVSSLKSLNSNKIKVPDASIVLDSSQCRGDSIDLFVNICNLGNAALPGGVPLAFYNGDPSATAAATLLFPPVIINEKIEQGTCINLKRSIPATYNTTIYTVVNDDGSLPRPFNWTTDFPATNQPECHYENNMASFSFPHQTPALDLGPDITLCKNSVVALSAGPGFQKYRWQNGSTDFNFTAYSAGKYWVDAFDGCGFLQSDTVNILLNTIDTLDLPDALTICAGEQLQLAASGFSGYSWSPTDSVSCSSCASVNVLAQKSITIQLTATKGGCFVSDSVRVIVHPKPVLSLSVQSYNCTDSVRIVANVAGAAPFNFSWSHGGTDSVFTTAQAGTYTVEITDQYGCQATDSAVVSQVNTLQISAQPTAPICANSATGAIEVTLIGGTAPFQFLWSNNSDLEDLSQVSAGVYSVVVTDANGCTAIISETLSAPPPINLSLQKTEPKCAGEASGALQLTASGGTGNLQFLWSNNATSEDLNLLPVGIYSLVVTDANGCTATISETLSAPPSINLSLQKTEPKCTGEASGALNLTASGGAGNLQFLWSNNATSEDLNLLSAGVYSLLVTDANGCTATISDTLSTPPPINLFLQKTEPKCADEASGALQLTASGGTGNLQFLWSNNATSEDLNLLSAGVYSLLVTDANGCTATISETLSAPPPIGLTLQKTEPKCADEASGALQLTASGGTGNLQFLWSNNATSEDLNLLPAGVYSLLVTDANGCTATISDTLSTPPPINLFLQKTEPKCADEASGALQLTASGGTGNLQYLWSNNATSEDLNLLLAGIYSLVVTDANGCTAIISDTLSAPPTIDLFLQKTEPKCAGEASGVLHLTASGGIGNLQFLWSNNATSEDLNLLPAGVYSLIVTDANGCTATISEILSEPPPIVLSLQKIDLNCPGDTGIVDLTLAGGVPPFAFLWSNGQTTEDIAIVQTGIYTVNVLDSNGCSLSETTALATLGTPPIVTLTTDTLHCQKTSGAISAGADLPNTTFQWSGPGGFLSADAAPIVSSSGTYSVTATEPAGGCTATGAVEVIEIAPPTGTFGADSVRCFAETNGAIRVVSTTGGIPPLRYSLDNQNFQTDPVFENLTAGVYPVFIRDAIGCLFSTEIEVGQPAPIGVELTGDSVVTKGTLANLQAIVSPPGFVPAQIIWSATGIDFDQNKLEQSVQLFQNTLALVEIADEHGCSVSDTWLVRVQAGHNIYVPNAISPESPNAANQEFTVYADANVREIESLQIFDRWGSLVFSNEHLPPNDESQGWNGTFRGKLLNAGVYVWVAKVVYIDGTTAILKGGLTLLR